ncbi:DNA polymerase kappa-like [Watersipora subatra]|uniref:DNA polymerase kappa-like n=1 Tax=Watersipora subatra TaxID=2589382 RepID=UPI00355C5DF8
MAARIGLNDNKAGMEGLDKEKINKIIYEASKGSKFYQNELKKDQAIQEKINSLKEKLAQASEAQLAECQAKADKRLSLLHQQYDFTRYIVHMDMDAFYAAVEMRDNPKLRDVPMAVGDEAMLSTSNYVARRYGVRAAMPGFIARKLCPQLILVPGSMAKYTAVSRVIKAILREYDPHMSPMSLDEAYIDFTEHMKRREELDESERTLPEYSDDSCRCESTAVATRQSTNHSTVKNRESLVVGAEDKTEKKLGTSPAPSPVQPAADCLGMGLCPQCSLPFNPRTTTFGLSIEEAVKEMRHRIHLKTKLTASAGIAPNSLLAKICSDRNKPNGQFLLPFDVEHVQEFVKDLPIRKIPGIGKVSEKQLLAFDISTCKDFHKHRDILYFLFSEGSFEYFMSVYMGLGSNNVVRSDEGPKSKSVERTFRNISDPNELFNMCYDLSLELSEDLQSAGNLMGRTVTLKIKLASFELKTRSQSLASVTNDGDQINRAACSLLRTEIKAAHPKPLVLRLMGVRMSNFSSDSAKQKKLTVTKVDPNSQSFFESIDRSSKIKTGKSSQSSLGLLAYMADYKPSSLQCNSKSSCSNHKAPPDSLDRFALKRKDIWENKLGISPRKVLQAGSAGEVTVCSLIDSDSAGDNFDMTCGKYPLSSTPRRSKNVMKSADTDPSNSTRAISKTRNRNVAAKLPVPSGKIHAKETNKTVASYFTGTKSVWDDVQQSSDEDIVYISGGRPVDVQRNGKKNKRKAVTSREKLKKKNGSQQLLVLEANRQTRRKNTRTIVDRDIITLDSD